jgi:biotin carboxyl carrier protein
MKMMNEIKATVAGIVGALRATEGVPVAANDLLCIIEPPE